jgi:mannose-6-phosphate isomerase
MTVQNSETVDRPHVVPKPWGHEEIFALVPGKFCGKVLHVRAGHSLSLQYHRQKEEVISVYSGTARVRVGPSLDELREVELHPGDGLHLPPGVIHRIAAVTDLVMLEASTTELDDVVRLVDDYGRAGAAIAGAAAASVPNQTSTRSPEPTGGAGSH